MHCFIAFSEINKLHQAEQKLKKYILRRMFKFDLALFVTLSASLHVTKRFKIYLLSFAFTLLTHSISLSDVLFSVDCNSNRVRFFAKADISLSFFSSQIYPQSSFPFETTNDALSKQQSTAGKSNNTEAKYCKKLEVLLVSKLPLNILSLFPAFAKTEELDKEESVKINLKHPEVVDTDEASSANNNNKKSEALQNEAKELDDVNPRVVVLNAETKEIWRVHTPPQSESSGAIKIFDGVNESSVSENNKSGKAQVKDDDPEDSFQEKMRKNKLIPIFDTETESATIFRILAPITESTEALSSSFISQILHVDVQFGLGLFGNYCLSAVDSLWNDHKHNDKNHRAIADLDIQYKRCDVINHTIHVEVTIHLSNCKFMKFGYEVKCHKLDFLQGYVDGFEVGLSAPRLFSSFPTYLDKSSLSLSYLISSIPTGNVVSNGKTHENYSTVKDMHLLETTPMHSKYTDLFVWCRGCSKNIFFKYPSVVSDLEILSPVINLVDTISETEAKNKHKSSQRSEFFMLKDVSLNVLKEGNFFAKNFNDNDYVYHFQLHYNCIKKGQSLVSIEFAFHEYQNVQIFFKKICYEKDSSVTSDSQCWMGILSEDKKFCCSAICAICGGPNCYARNGGIENCCGSHILFTKRYCDEYTSPCIMRHSAAPSFIHEQAQYSHVAAFSSVLYSFFFWCIILALWLYICLAYDKYSRGCRGLDLFPSLHDLSFSLKQIVSKVIGCIKKTKRDLNDKNRREKYMSMLPYAMRNVSSYGKANRNSCQMVILNDLELEKDDLGRMDDPPSAFHGKISREENAKKKIVQYDYGSI